MAFEEKYEKRSIDYIVNVIKRKVIGGLYAYPEFMFLLKISVLIILAFIIFTIFRNTFGL
jgi:hypothetical protein